MLAQKNLREIDFAHKPIIIPFPRLKKSKIGIHKGLNSIINKYRQNIELDFNSQYESDPSSELSALDNNLEEIYSVLNGKRTWINRVKDLKKITNGYENSLINNLNLALENRVITKQEAYKRLEYVKSLINTALESNYLKRTYKNIENFGFYQKAVSITESLKKEIDNYSRELKETNPIVINIENSNEIIYQQSNKTFFDKRLESLVFTFQENQKKEKNKNKIQPMKINFAYGLIKKDLIPRIFDSIDRNLEKIFNPINEYFIKINEKRRQKRILKENQKTIPTRLSTGYIIHLEKRKAKKLRRFIKSSEERLIVTPKTLEEYLSKTFFSKLIKAVDLF